MHRNLVRDQEVEGSNPLWHAIVTLPKITPFWARTPGVLGRQNFKGFMRSVYWGFWAVKGFWASYKGRLPDPFADSPNSAAIFAQEAPCAHREPQGVGLVSESATTHTESADSPRTETSQNPVSKECDSEALDPNTEFGIMEKEPNLRPRQRAVQDAFDRESVETN